MELVTPLTVHAPASEAVQGVRLYVRTLALEPVRDVVEDVVLSVRKYALAAVAAAYTHVQEVAKAHVQEIAKAIVKAHALHVQMVVPVAQAVLALVAVVVLAVTAVMVVPVLVLEVAIVPATANVQDVEDPVLQDVLPLVQELVRQSA